MKSFIEKQATYGQGPQRNYPPRHQCDLSATKQEFKVTNAQLS